MGHFVNVSENSILRDEDVKNVKRQQLRYSYLEFPVPTNQLQTQLTWVSEQNLTLNNFVYIYMYSI